MRERRATGSEVDGSERWQVAAVALRERGRLAWALGAALEEALSQGSASAECGVEALEAIVSRALAQAAMSAAVSEQAVAQGSRPQASPRRSTPTGDAVAVWRQMQGCELGSRSMPLVWFASGGAGSQRVTLALGVGADGGKHVLGVWMGGAGEHRCSQLVAADLRSRGLGRGTSWLAVTEGERALAVALRQHWPSRVMVAHCQVRVAAAVAGHLPAGMREQAELALRRAWDLSEAASVQRALEDLASAWRQAHPGAAARLRTETEPTAVTQALGLHGALAQRLRTAAPARYLLEQCVPAARGRSGREWVAVIAAEARRRQDGFRRLPEHAALGDLTRALAERQSTAAVG